MNPSPDPELDPTLSNPSSKPKNRKRKSQQITIQTTHEHPDKIAPLIGYFPSGYDPIPADNDRREPPEVRVLRNQKKPNRLEVVVSPSGSKVEFVGTNYAGEGAVPQVCSYGLGILDKETGILKIVPIASNKIFRLEPRIRGLDIVDNEPLSNKEEITAEEKADKRRVLIDLYGTNKAKRMSKKIWTLRQTEDPNSKEALDKDIVINKEALRNVGAEVSRNIPPHDTSATKPEDAYPLHKIILRGEWDYLLDIFELVETGSQIADDAFPNFVGKRIHSLRDIKDETEKKQQACILSYISHLIKFKDQHSMEGMSSSKKFGIIPDILFQKFKIMFGDSDLKFLSDEKKDLLVSYVLVLTLFADSFRCDTTDLARDLRMNPPIVRVHYQHLGCKVSRENNIFYATLPLPLQFKNLTLYRRKKNEYRGIIY